MLLLRGLLLAVLGTTAAAQRTVDLSFLSCWNDPNRAPLSRSLTSSTIDSSTHWRAYATVTASADGRSCQNTTTLYVAPPTGPFKRVFQRGTTGTQDGNGARIVGWSPAGNKLLVEITDWAYGSDAQLGRTMLIYEPGKPVQTPPIWHTLDQRFGENCLYDFSTLGWASDSAVLVKVRPYREDEDIDNRPSCVSKLTVFSYNIGTQSLRPANVRH